MKKSLLFIALAISQISLAQNECVVTIPDTNFKNALLNHHTVVDTNGDGKIQCSEAENYVGELSLQFSNIEDLTGIEAFTNVSYINCSGNALTELDVSHNKELNRLDCNNNQLSTIDVSSNTKLQALYCGENLMTSVDVSGNSALMSFHATGSLYLEYINLANGNNTMFTRMMVDGSPNLTCIQVDDPAYSTINWTYANGNYNLPPQAQFSSNCFLSVNN